MNRLLSFLNSAPLCSTCTLIEMEKGNFLGEFFYPACRVFRCYIYVKFDTSYILGTIPSYEGSIIFPLYLWKICHPHMLIYRGIYMEVAWVSTFFPFSPLPEQLVTDLAVWLRLHGLLLGASIAEAVYSFKHDSWTQCQREIQLLWIKDILFKIEWVNIV